MNRGRTTCALLADKHTAFVDGLRGLLQETFDAVFVVADARSLHLGTECLQPTVIVVDLPLAEGDVAGLIQRVRQTSPKSKLIALSVHDEPAVVTAVMSAGADCVVFKHWVARDLLRAIDTALEGKTFVTPDIGLAS